MANTYIHTLPDSPDILDPKAYTLLDYKNIYDEYTTSKLELSSLSHFVNSEYIISDEHLKTKQASSWVNSNSSNLIVQSLLINNVGNLNNIYPVYIVDNRNNTSQIFIQNQSLGNDALTEINFQNSLSATAFKIGVLGENYNQVGWTIGDTKNDGYLIAEEKNLVIGSQGFDKDLILFTGGPFGGNERIVAKGDGSGYVGINTNEPNVHLTVNGFLSTNNIIFDSFGNSNDWNQSYSYVLNNSSKNTQSTSFVELVSSNLVFRTGSLITGVLNTTQTLTAFFGLDEFVSRRYVDAVLLQSTVSGNFIPALYYTKTEVDNYFIDPYSVYSEFNSMSSLELESRTFVNNNSSTFLSLNTNINQTSGNWESVYSYVNQASGFEKNQQEVTSFVISNSTNLLEVHSFVNNNSGSLNELYTFTANNSSLDLEVTSYVSSNSSQINQNNIFVRNLTVFDEILSEGSINMSVSASDANPILDITHTNSAINGLILKAKNFNNSNHLAFGTNGVLELMRDGDLMFLDAGGGRIVSEGYNGELNFKEQKLIFNGVNAFGKSNESYTTYSNASGTYASYSYVNNGFLPLSGGNVTGNLFAGSLGVGNTIVVAGTLGTLSRKMEIFDINGNSLGFIPVYGSID